MAKSMKTLMITKRIKNIVHSNLSKSESFNIENLFDYNFEGVDDIRKVIDKIPLISLFTEMKELNKPYKCILFKSNKAWISEDTMNRQRYFTKNRKGDVYSFDLIDILEFYYNEPINNVFTILNDMFSIEYQIKWKNEHEYKYYYNFDAMLGLKMEDKYKNLRQIIGKFIPELHKINEFGRDNIKNKKFCHKKENIFFFSNTYLLRQSQYKSKSTINKIINLFCFLGLLEKVPYNRLNLLQSKESINKEKINPLTFYIIPRYNDKILTEADKRCRYMIDNNLKYYKLRNHDYAYLQHMFNTPVIINGQNKRPDKQAVVMNNINKEFSRMLNDCNMVSKELITRNVKCSKKTVDKQWGYLIKKNRLLSRRPTIKEKEEYNLNTNLYIATR